MTTYRFRMKFDPDPTALWRDIVIGADRTLQELQRVINDAFGLDRDHLWFFAPDQEFWNSDVTYESPQEIDHGVDLPFGVEEHRRDASQTTVKEFVSALEMSEGDRFCYLYDYGDEWRFYAILKGIRDEQESDHPPTVTDEKGPPLQQYAPPDGPAPGVPETLADLLPDGPMPSSAVQTFEDHDEIEIAIPVHEYENWNNTVVDRVLVQATNTGYILEFSPMGWEVVREVKGKELSTEELLAELVKAARAWHEEIAEITSTVTNREFSDAVIEDMHSTLHAELGRRGYHELIATND